MLLLLIVSSTMLNGEIPDTPIARVLSFPSRLKRFVYVLFVYVAHTKKLTRIFVFITSVN